MIGTRCVLLLVLYEVTTAVSGRCNRYYGPAGDTECVKLQGYDGHQTATCLTNTYIQAKSNQRHVCQGSPFTTYCYYQCMCEMYDECDGPSVRNLCSCNPDGDYDLQQPISLPSWCFSPNGTTCSWYKDCLQQRYPCPGSSASNAITYAKKFCDLYADYQSSFTSRGQAWIAAVRKCLQIELVPILRPWESLNITCVSIKDLAFASHSKCYSTLSFCSLTFNDQLKTFWTIKGGFDDAFLDTMKSFWDIIYGCLKQFTTNVDLIDNKLARVEIVVRKHAYMESNPNKFAGKIVDTVALNQKWASQGLAWYGFNDEQKNSTEFSVSIILVQERDFDLNAPFARVTSLSNVVRALGNSATSSLTCLSVDDVYVDVLSMTVCNDFSCSSAFFEVSSLPKCTGTSFKISSLLVLSVGIFVLVIL